MTSPSDKRLLDLFYLRSERAAVDYVDEVVDGQGRLQYLDKVRSVSGLIEIEEDYEYDPDHIQLNVLCVDPQVVNGGG